MQLFDVKTASEKLAISEPTMRRLLDSGKIKAFRVGDQIRISEESINEYLNQNCYARESNKRGRQKC